MNGIEEIAALLRIIDLCDKYGELSNIRKAAWAQLQAINTLHATDKPAPVLLEVEVPELDKSLFGSIKQMIGV
jgi:hypothetical protein